MRRQTPSVLQGRDPAIEAAQLAPSGTNRSRALLGLLLALMARKAEPPEADPDILATLSSAVDRRYPHVWSEEERGQALARDLLEPLSITLLASSLSNRATGRATDAEASETSPSSGFSG